MSISKSVSGSFWPFHISGFDVKTLFAQVFSFTFYTVSAIILLHTCYSGIGEIIGGADLTQVVIKIVNSSVIAVALFELAVVISKEYSNMEDHEVADMLRRTLPRFIGTVCVALSLEGLIMIIKYSQLELAGNLYYPVAIIVSAALLLASLGLFLKLANPPATAESGM